MNKKKKAVIISVSVLVFLILAVTAFCFVRPFVFHVNMVNASLDFSDCVLENENYSLIINEDKENKAIGFEIKDKNDGSTVFESPYSVRSRDCKSINITDDNDVIIESGDIGTVKYEYDESTSTWKYKYDDLN